MLIRPMTPDDVAAAQTIKSDAFDDLRLQTALPGSPLPERPKPVGPDTEWSQRVHGFLVTDPGGCWVADLGGEVVGLVTSIIRERTWILATYAVRPGLQGQGIGKPLLDAALDYGRGCLHALFAASDDAKAARRYLLAGFELHPQMTLTGQVDRSALPAIDRVRGATVDDTELMDSVDRRARGAAHGTDHHHLQRHFRGLLVDDGTGSGYAYVDADGRLKLLAASNRRTAARLLWTVLAEGPTETYVDHITAANQWALQVGTAARLRVGTQGHLAVRGMKPPTPYIHHGALL